MFATLFATGIVVQGLGRALGFEHAVWRVPLALALAALVCGLVGLRLNERWQPIAALRYVGYLATFYFHGDSSRRPDFRLAEHTAFFVRLELWAVALVAGAGYLLVYPPVS